jgi:hypothetical protein
VDKARQQVAVRAVGAVDATAVLAALREAQQGVEFVRALVERLAPGTLICDSDLGYCVWCEATHDATADPATHAADCPWIAARTWLGQP